MSRATSIYILMLIIFGTGLWTILSFGSLLLQAPEDLAGEWQLYDINAAPDADPDKTMFIDQSGRYFKIRLNGIVLDLTLEQEQRYFDRALELTLVKLGDGFSLATFHGPRRGHEFLFQLSGITDGTWVARRASRPYGPDHFPRHVTAPRPTTLPATGPSEEEPSTAPADVPQEESDADSVPAHSAPESAPLSAPAPAPAPEPAPEAAPAEPPAPAPATS